MNAPVLGAVTTAEDNSGAGPHGQQAGLMSAGLPSSAPRPILTAVILAEPNPWDIVRRYIDGAEKFARCTLACQVMAGMQLLHLHKKTLVRAGRRGNSVEPQQDAAQLPSNLVINPPGETWPETVRREIGKSDETARAWMAMAQACKPRLKRLTGAEILSKIIDLPISQLTPDQLAALTKAVHKITDGQTQIEFIESLGVVKLAQGSGCKGGYHPKGGEPAPELSPEQQADALRELARKDFGECVSALNQFGKNCILLSDHEIEITIHILEKSAKALQLWLRTPVPKRDPKLVQQTLKF